MVEGRRGRGCRAVDGGREGSRGYGVGRQSGVDV
jgi:hypothetical protein